MAESQWNLMIVSADSEAKHRKTFRDKTFRPKLDRILNLERKLRDQTMVAQIVSQVLKELGSILTEEVKRRGKLVVGAEKDVKKLKSTFSAIQSLLLDAEERQLSDKAVENWVMKLKNICFEIDDVLDEWRTAILKRRIEEEEDADDDCDVGYGWLELKLHGISNILNRVCPFLPCFSVSEVGLRYDIASRIKELYEDLDRIDKDKNMFQFSPRESSTKPHSLQTSPNIGLGNVKGREVEIKILREKLLHQDPSANVQSISIQGIGGLGKTTLAKLLYNDADVTTYFDKRIWVCVSDTFDQAKIAKSIHESLLPGDAKKDKTLSNMLEEIHEMIEGRRFLLVLDDSWEPSRNCWEELLSSVSSGSPGSKILVTTRKGEVSHTLDCTQNNVILIGKLSEDACRALFTKIAFHGWTLEEEKRLEDLCKGMLKKCGGSPLAVKVLAGVLRAKKSRREWLHLLKSEMWNLKEVKEEVFGPLALSYYDLSPELRQCFQFCAVFPKDYEIEKDQLIKVWIAQGFVRAEEDEEIEDIGEEYFKILTTRSLFQDIHTREENGGVLVTTLHDLVHDFAQLVSKKECSNMIMNEDATTTTTPIASGISRSMVRNLMIESTWRSRPINGPLFSLMTCLRSFRASYVYAIEPDTFGHLRGIRSLVLSECSLREIPTTINRLIHLRLLDLSGNQLEELPDEICELYNLWALILNGNDMLEKLPLEIGKKLVNLTHFENFGVPALLPKSIGRLASHLKTLSYFMIVPDQPEESATIVDLKDMNHLRGTLMVLGLRNVTDCNEVEQAHFARKTCLNCLWLVFSSAREEDEDEDLSDSSSAREEDEEEEKDVNIPNEEELLEAVRPPTNLGELDISLYNGASVSPSWMMSLTNLTRLAIMGCLRAKFLPCLGGLPSLEEVTFEYMPKVKKVGVELLGQEQQSSTRAFPRLTTLRFNIMENWEEWDDGTLLSSPSVMPRLRVLSVASCGSLNKFPDSILRKATLEHLEVRGSGGFGSYRFDPNRPKMVSYVWEKISHICTIEFDGVNIRKKFKSQIARHSQKKRDALTAATPSK